MSDVKTPAQIRAIFPPTTSRPEPLLHRDNTRFTLLPMRYPEAYNTYERARKGNWEAGEGDLSEDLIQIRDVLTPAEKNALYMTFAFFQPADGIVGENHITTFYNEICVPEMRFYYAYQASIESVHAVVYGRILEQLVPDVTERLNLLHAIDTIPAVKGLTDWATVWMEQGTFQERLFAFSLVEGLFFSAPFCIIFWFKKRGLLPGVSFFNELINRDENQHTQYGPFIVWPHVVNKLSHPHMRTIVDSAMSVLYPFVDALLPEPLNGMNAKLMKEHCESVADYILGLYDVAPLYSTPCPFPWMTLMGFGDTKTSIFERKVAEYTRANHSVTHADVVNFSVTEDF